MPFWTSRFYGSSGDTRRDGFQNPAPRIRDTAATVTFDSAMSVSAFWASARLLTETVAAMPLKAFDIDDETLVRSPNTNYDLWRLINFQPNKRQTRVEFFENIVMNLCVWGNAYVAIEKTARGRIVALTPLMSSQMEVLLDNGEIIYQYTVADGDLRLFAESSIWHIRLFGNGVVGMSPLAYAATSLGIAIAADNRVSTLAESGGKATGILTVDSALTEQQRLRIQENFKGLEQGNADELFVLEAGFKYQQTSLSPADMQLLENRRFQVEDIARFMGVPSVLINDTSATTTWGSGIEQIVTGFYKLNLTPYLERIEASIIRNLMPRADWGKISMQFDFDALLRSDIDTRIKAAAAGVNAALLTPNEGRAKEGLKPKDGGDKLYLNSALLPIGEPRPDSTNQNNFEGDSDGTQTSSTSTD